MLLKQKQQITTNTIQKEELHFSTLQICSLLPTTSLHVLVYLLSLPFMLT